MNKEKILQEAKEQGIIDIDTHGSNDKISLSTVELATKLMKKHGPETYKRLEEIRKKQNAG
jgi:hypothetical protein